MLFVDIVIKEKENAISQMRHRNSETVEDLKETISSLEDKVQQKSLELKLLKAKLEYEASDKKKELSYASELKHSLENQNVNSSRKLRQSQRIIRDCKEEIGTLKRELEYKNNCMKKYKRRSERLHKKFSKLLEDRDNVELERTRIDEIKRRIYDARIINNGGNVYYSLWCQESKKNTELMDKVASLEKELQSCKDELQQEKDEVITSKEKQSRLEDKIKEMNLRFSFNTFALLMMGYACIKKIHSLQLIKEKLELQLATQMENLCERLVDWGGEWEYLNHTTKVDIDHLKSILSKSSEDDL
jgi:DNA repair exonuclease SbcCD ATPase subunit